MSCDKSATYYCGYTRSEHTPKKIWLNCVNDYMSQKGVGTEMTADKGFWRKTTCCAEPEKWEKDKKMTMK